MNLGRNKKKIKITCAAVLALLLAAGLWIGVTRGATNPTWTQTAWTARTTNTVAHDPAIPGRNNWTQYSTASDTSLNTTGGVKLAPQASRVSYPSPNTFSGTGITLNNTAIVSGAGEKIQFQPAITDPFVDNTLQKLVVGTAEAPKLAVGKSMVKVGNYIYAFFTFKKFGRFSISTQTWEYLADTPAEVGVGSCLSYLAGSTHIYALQGSGTKNFWRYTLPDATYPQGIWESTQSNPTILPALTYPVSYGGSLVVAQDNTGDVVLYCFPGANTSNFLKFRNNISPIWSNTNLPSSVAYGDLAYNSSNNRIYAASESGFYYLALNASKNPSGAWQTLATTTGLDKGATLYWPGFGNFIYTFSGSYGEYFACYDMTQAAPGSWQTLTRPFNSHFQTWQGGYRRGLLYAEEISGTTKLRLLSPSNIDRLYDYEFTTASGPASGKWTGFIVATPTTMTRAIQVIHPDPGIAEYANYLYVLSYNNFWRYDKTTNSWNNFSSYASLPYATASSTQAVFMRHQDGAGGPNVDYIYYAADPGLLYRCKLDPATGEPMMVDSSYWNVVTPVSGSFPNPSYYASLGRDNQYIYYLSGTNQSSYDSTGAQNPRNLYQYDPVNNTVILANASDSGYAVQTSGRGVAMVMGKGGSVYFTRGSNSSTGSSSPWNNYSKYIYRRDAATGNWYSSAASPFQYLVCSSLSWTADDPDYIYVKGYAGNNYWYAFEQVFMRYSIPENPADFGSGTWEWLTPPISDDHYSEYDNFNQEQEPSHISKSYGWTMQGTAFIGKTLFCAISYSDEFLAYDIDNSSWSGKNQVYYNTKGWRNNGTASSWEMFSDLNADNQFYNYYMDRYWVDNVYAYYNGQGIIYQFCAPYKTTNNIIQRYSINDDKWLEPIKSPFPIERNTKAVYSNGKLYVVRGGLTDQMWAYDISSGLWGATPITVPFRIGVSTAICSNQLSGIEERIFVIDGATWLSLTGAGKKFSSYAPAFGEWFGADDAPDGASYMGTSMVSVPYANKIYALFGRPVNKFRSFSLASGNTAWNSLSAENQPVEQLATFATTTGTSMCYVESEKAVYMVSENQAVLFRYLVDTKTWEEVSVLPTIAARGAKVIYPQGVTGKENYLYIYLGDRDGSFYRYYIPGKKFSGIDFLPRRMTTLDASVAASGKTIYYLKDALFAYTGTWEKLANSDWATSDNCSLVYVAPGTGHTDARLYATIGYGSSGFSYYSLTNNQWVSCASLSLPSYTYYGSAMVTDGAYIYFIAGGNTTFFARYDIANNTWQALQATPEVVYYGADLIYYPPLGLIFLAPGNGKSTFYAYDPAVNAWSETWTRSWQPDSLPLAVGADSAVNRYGGGVSLAYAGGGYLYAFITPTGETNYAYRYSVNTDVAFGSGNSGAWEEINPLPRNLQSRVKAVYPGNGDYFYIFPGRMNINIYPYLAFASGSYISAVKNIGNNSGFDIAGWSVENITDPAQTPVTFKIRSANNEKMAGALDFSNCVALNTSGQSFANYSSVKPADKYIQWQLDFITYDPSIITNPSKPAITNYYFDFLRYPEEQALISSAYNSSFVKNRLLKLSWDTLKPQGTNLLFQLRTATSAANLASAEWLGPVPAFKQVDILNSATSANFAAEDEIEFTSTDARVKEICVGFQFHKEVNIDNPGGTTLLNYPVKLIIDSSNSHFWNNIQADGADLRFTDELENLKYGFEKFSYRDRYAVIWVRIPEIPVPDERTIFMYYGNPLAVREDNSEEVFDTIHGMFFDDFNGPNFSTSNWQPLSPLIGASIDFINTDDKSVVRFRGTNGNTPMSWPLISNQSFDISGGIALESLEKRDGGTYVSYLDTQIWQDSANDFGSSGGYGGSGRGVSLYNTYGGSLTGPNKGIKYVNGDWCLHSLIKDANGTISGNLLIDDAYKNAAANITSASISSGKIRLFSMVAHRPYLLDWLRLRKYSNPEPVASLAPVKLDSGTYTLAGIGDFSRREKVVINNSSVDTLVDHIVEIVVNKDHASYWSSSLHPRYASGADTRFADISGNTIYSHWEKDYSAANTRATFWVKIPQLNPGENILYLYYANASVASASSTGIFLFYDNFANLSNFDYSTHTTADVSISGNIATIKYDVADVASESFATYLATKNSWLKEKNLTFYCLFNQYDNTSGGEVNYDYLGLINGDYSFSSPPYSANGNMPYGFYFENSQYYNRYMYGFLGSGSTFKQSTFAGSVGAGENWYEARITLQDSGAKYYFRQKGEKDWRFYYNYPANPLTFTSVRPAILHRSGLNTAGYQRSYTASWIVYKQAPEESVTVIFDYEPQTTDSGKYYATNPVLQAYTGVFYNKGRDGLYGQLRSFEEISTKPSGTGIKYQISDNGWDWYYYNGSQWATVPADGGYSYANDAATVNTHLGTTSANDFMRVHPEGVFCYRAFLHSDNGENTPALQQVTVTFEAEPSWYSDPSGMLEQINSGHSDATSDQWVQYKAILYSQGADTPVLNSVSLEYSSAEISVTSPVSTNIWNIGETKNITWTSSGLEEKNVRIDYFDGTNWKIGGVDPAGITGSCPNDTKSFAWYIDPVKYKPNANAKIKIVSVDYTSVFAESATFKLYGALFTQPVGGEIWEIGEGITKDIRWQTFGLTSSADDRLTLAYSYNGTNWFTILDQIVGSTTPNSTTWELTPTSSPVGPIVESNSVSVRLWIEKLQGIVSMVNVSFVPEADIVVDSPLQTAQVVVGEPQIIRWHTNSKYFSNRFNVEYSPKGDFTDTKLINTVVLSGIAVPPTQTNINDNVEGTCAWTVTDNNDISTTAKIRITEVAPIPSGRVTPVAVKTSEAFVIKAPTITVNSPASTDEWVAGDVEDIAWVADGVLSAPASGSLKVEYSTDNFTTNIHQINAAIFLSDGVYKCSWSPIEILAADGTAFNIPAQGQPVKIRVTDLGYPNCYSDSSEFKVLANAKVTLLQHNGGTPALLMGQTYEVKWETTGKSLLDKTYDLYYSVDNGETYTRFTRQRPVDQSGAANTAFGAYTWTIPTQEIVPNIMTDLARIKVCTTDGVFCDVSDAVFTITNPKITIIQPNGNEILYATGKYNIIWNSEGEVGEAVNLLYSTNGGASFSADPANPSLPNVNNKADNTFLWPIIDADNEITGAQLRIAKSNDANIHDDSDSSFTIKPPQFTLTSPSGTEEWVAGTEHTINWSSEGFEQGAIRNVSMQYKVEEIDTDWSSSFYDITPTVSSGTFNWTVPSNSSYIGKTCKVRVFDKTRFNETRPSTYKESSFKIITPYIKITKPVLGDAWAIGSGQDIEWYSLGGVSGSWIIEYSKNNFTTAGISINSGEVEPYQVDPDGKSYYRFTWAVPDDYSSTVKIRIKDQNNETIVDAMQYVFSISSPIIEIDPPIDGNLYTVGDTVEIKWKNTGSVEQRVRLFYSTDNFQSVIKQIPDPGQDTLIDNTSPGGLEPYETTYQWAIPAGEQESTRIRLRITEARDAGSPHTWPVYSATSGNFTFLPVPVITVLSPNGNVDINQSERWRRGTEQTITWSRNNGAFSNNLAIYISTDGGTGWVLIKDQIPKSTSSYTWTVPESLAISDQCKIMVKDDGSGRDPKPSDESDNYFRTGYPTITITSPQGGEFWAVNDISQISWLPEGTISSSVSFEYSHDAGTYPSQNKKIINNTGSYTWTVPDYIGVTYVRLTDTQDPNNIVSESRQITIIEKPTITLTAPNGGAGVEYEVGSNVPITWTSQGLSIHNLKIDYSNDNFTLPANIKEIASNLNNTGSLSGGWTIPLDALTGQAIKVRIRAHNHASGAAADPSNTIYEINEARSANNFRIKGGLEFTSPAGGEVWVAKSPHAITWNNKGNIPNVKLEYSTDGGTTYVATPIIDNLSNPAVTGSYNWQLPDIQENTQIRLRISNALDPTEVRESGNFSIIYATVEFHVKDQDTGAEIPSLTVSESTGWKDSPLNSPIKRVRTYPYGSYVTSFEQADYVPTSATWLTQADFANLESIQIVNVQAETIFSAQATWESKLTYTYDVASNVFSGVGSLQKRGKLIGSVPEDLVKLGRGTLKIFEPDGSALKFPAIEIEAPDNNGMYKFTITNAEFEGGKVYPATLSIVYSGNPFTSSASIVVTNEVTQTALAEQLTAATSQIVTAVATTAAETQSTVAVTAAETQRKVVEAKAQAVEEIKGHVTSVLTSTEGKLTKQVEEVRQQTVTGIKSEILNRENTVRSSQPLTIRYRTYPSVAPIIQVYSPENRQMLQANMRAIATGQETTVYEYTVLFDGAWGKGDFTIICSEASYGSMDALIISVIKTDIESIAGNVAAVLGTTSGISTLKDVADSLNSQFSIIESALSRVGKELVGEAKEASASSQALESVFKQLTGIANQVKGIAGKASYNLDKLYEVSSEKKNDISYLKNKTQQLKATMEVNKKMIDNIANKPVTQVWYEYR